MTNDRFLSCDDIQNSLYLAPNSVRVCCKRFFVNGVRKGDVELLTIYNPIDDLSPTKIYESKLKLIEIINTNTENVCSGCPYLRESDWGLPNLVPSNLSLEYHSICNLKCTYCSDVYYGGERAKYNVQEFLKKIIDSNSCDKLKSIVWGGGEPFLDPDKEGVFNALEELLLCNPQISFRVFSNSLNYEKRFKSMLDKFNVYLTTSIDAGTEEVYKLIRGKNKLHKVLENLAKYAENKPHNITIKYIFTELNSTKWQVNEFVRLIQEYKLLPCNFQISVDFNMDLITVKNFEACISLYNDLLELGANAVFLDDLVWLRLRKFYQINRDKLQAKFKILEQKKMLARNLLGEDIIIWGAGGIGLDMIKNSIFLRQNKVVAFVDNRYQEIDGHLFNGLPVFPPSYLKSHKGYVIIAAAQSYPSILCDFENMGIDRERLISGLVL